MLVRKILNRPKTLLIQLMAS